MQITKTFIPMTFKSICMFHLIVLSAAYPAGSELQTARAPQSSNRVVIVTSDGSTFKGTLIEKEDPLVTLRTAEEEEINLPIDELLYINGQSAKVFLKTFIPPIPDKLFKNFETNAHPKLTFSYTFLMDWEEAVTSWGKSYTAPKGDRKWEGYGFTFNFESPPKLKGDPNFKSILSMLSGSNYAILDQEYEIVLGTPTLLTTELDSNGMHHRSIWQFRDEKGEKCLIHIALTNLSKEKLTLPLPNVLFEKAVKSAKCNGTFLSDLSKPAAVSGSPDKLSVPYVSSKSNFRIRPPRGWKTDDSGTMGTLVIFLNANPDKSGQDSFSANITVVTEATQTATLESYVTASRKMLRKLVTNYKSTGQKKVAVNGRSAYVIGGTFSMGVYRNRNMQMILAEEGKTYIVTATALQSAWNKHKDAIEASLMTFEP